MSTAGDTTCPGGAAASAAAVSDAPQRAGLVLISLILVGRSQT
jgi:hypothetical protein